jgi:hypothetical protein
MLWSLGCRSKRFLFIPILYGLTTLEAHLSYHLVPLIYTASRVQRYVGTFEPLIGNPYSLRYRPLFDMVICVRQHTKLANQSITIDIFWHALFRKKYCTRYSSHVRNSALVPATRHGAGSMFPTSARSGGEWRWRARICGDTSTFHIPGGTPSPQRGPKCQLPISSLPSGNTTSANYTGLCNLPTGLRTFT